MIYTIEPDDNLADSWLFFEDDLSGKLIIREEYRDLGCSACGKLDEQVALSRGLSPNFVVRSRRDFVATSEDWICVSKRFREFVESAGFEGLKFLPLIDSEFSVLVPACLVETDEIKAAFENHRKCGDCGRYGERVIGPLLEGMKLPESEATFFASNIANENVKVGYHPFFASKTIVKALRNQELSGIDYVEAT